MSIRLATNSIYKCTYLKMGNTKYVIYSGRMFCQVCDRRLSRFELDVVTQNIKTVELIAARYFNKI